MQQQVAAQPAQPPQPEGVIVVYVGPMQGPQVAKLRTTCGNVVNQKIKKLTIFLQSAGGVPDEGFALYGFLRSLPLELTIHAIGGIESIAGVVFLAADKRFCTEESHFLFHEFTWTYAGQTQDARHLEGIRDSLKASEGRYVQILEKRTALTQKTLDDLDAFKKITIILPGEAKEKGIVQDVKDAAIPAGWLVYNIEP